MSSQVHTPIASFDFADVHISFVVYDVQYPLVTHPFPTPANVQVVEYVVQSLSLPTDNGKSSHTASVQAEFFQMQIPNPVFETDYKQTLDPLAV